MQTNSDVSRLVNFASFAVPRDLCDKDEPVGAKHAKDRKARKEVIQLVAPVSLTPGHLLLDRLDTLPRESRFFAIGKPPHEVAVGFAIVDILRSRFIEVENDMKLAVAIKANIIHEVRARTRVPTLVRAVGKSLARALGQRLRGAVGFISHQQQGARCELRVAEALDQEPAKRDSIERIL
jgi:hypothetical protein